MIILSIIAILAALLLVVLALGATVLLDPIIAILVIVGSVKLVKLLFKKSKK